MKPLRHAHGVTLRYSQGMYIIQYGRNRVSTDKALTALLLFDQFVLKSIANDQQLDIYYPDQPQGAIKNDNRTNE